MKATNPKNRISESLKYRPASCLSTLLRHLLIKKETFALFPLNLYFAEKIMPTKEWLTEFVYLII